MRETTSARGFTNEPLSPLSVPTPGTILSNRARHRNGLVQAIIQQWCQELTEAEAPRTRTRKTDQPVIGMLKVTGWSDLHQAALEAMNSCGWSLTARASTALDKKRKQVTVTFRQAPPPGPMVAAWPYQTGQ